MKKLSSLLLLLLISKIYSQNVPQWEWATNIGQTFGSQNAKDICIDAFGSVYVVGNNLVNENCYGNILTPGNFITKYDKVGNFLWVKKIDAEITKITTDGLNNLFMTGNFTTNITIGNAQLINQGGTDFFITKYNSDGVFQWTNSFGGPNDDFCNNFTISEIGNLYLTGSFENTISFDNQIILSSTGYHFFIAKLNMSGTPLWADKGPENYNCRFGYYITCDKNENSYVIGEMLNPPTPYLFPGYFIVKYDSSGAIIFENKKWDEYECPAGISLDNNSNIYIIIHTGGHHSSCQTLFKFSPAFSLIWSKSLGCPGYGTQYAHDRGLTIDKNGNMYIAGTYGSYNSAAGDTIFISDKWLLSNGRCDAFIAKLDSMRNYIWLKSIGGKGYDVLETAWVNSPVFMTVDRLGNCFLASNYNLQNYLHPPYDSIICDNNILVQDGNWQQIFLAKLGSATPVNVTEIKQIQNSILALYPNPSPGKFNITGIPEKSKICIYDISGRCVYSRAKIADEEIDLSEKEKGIYFLEVIAENGIFRNNLVIE